MNFKFFYENREPLDLQDDTSKWYLAPIGMKHTPILEKDCTILKDNTLKGNLYYRFRVSLDQNETKNLYGKYVHQPVLIDRKGRIFRRAEGFINFKPQIKNNS